ncbi:HNH endonuclease family protein [Kitasatospora nipponensis]|uniref:HNH endonuclease family protein n=1 Tax=Kitasatospora nipponensis TaxID=258049 RepID=A0ABP4GXQ8_9ACTN
MIIARVLRPAILLALATALLAGLTTTPASAAAAHGHRSPGRVVNTTLYDGIEALPIAPEDRTGYVRTAFRHWIDADKDGCNTRKEVIIAEAVEAPTVGPGCSLTGGRWYSAYDGVTVTDSGALDVDHLVPLAEAWDSGASAWSPQEREAYANDLGEDRDLIAVTARSNRQKADKDVTDWLPMPSYVCTYITDWTVDKTRWGLTVDAAEKDRLHQLAAGCANEPITLELAR